MRKAIYALGGVLVMMSALMLGCAFLSPISQGAPMATLASIGFMVATVGMYQIHKEADNEQK